MITCPHCGTSNLDNAAICANCGRALAVPPPPSMPESQSQSQSYTPPPPPPGYSGYTPPAPYTGAPIPNYLVQSILVTLCCCLPLGVVALIFAAQVNSKIAAGDIEGARQASSKAKLFCIIAFVLGLVGLALVLLINGAAFLGALHANR
jgi:hypothetical protein